MVILCSLDLMYRMDIKLDKNLKYLIAVSGGPDSMALLDMVDKLGALFEVAHVNHHKRDTAKRDEDIVRNYCLKHNIKFHLLDIYPEEVKGNFQGFARDRRYEFFKDICLENNLDCVLVAHQLDDYLETYYMQKEKNMGVSYYGLKESTNIKGVKVYRPLLSYTKDDLVNYCNENNIEYGIDESNLEDHYTRNKIRHSIIDKMSLKEKKNLYSEIEKINKDNENRLKDVLNSLNKDEYDVDEFINIKDVKLGLRYYFNGKSDKFYDEMLRQIKDSNKYLYHEDNLYITKEYNKVSIFKVNEYSYTCDNLNELKNISNEYFKVSDKGDNFSAVTLNENDFPITIRNYIEGDSIKMRYGTKKLNRFFIDNKIPSKYRMIYPVVLNKNNEVILVPGVGCDVYHYSTIPNIFVIKLFDV